jgi:hypothetical protein
MAVYNLPNIQMRGSTMKKTSLLALLVTVAIPGFAGAQTKFPWQFGKEYVVNFKQGAASIGTEKVTFKQVKRDGKDAIEARNVVSLNVGGMNASLRCTFITTADAKPIEYTSDIEQGNVKLKIVSTFKDGRVATMISGAVNAAKEDPCPPDVFCFENNMLAGAMLAAPQFKLEVGKPFSMRGYYPSILMMVKMTLDPKALKAITIGGKSLECYECQIPEINGTIWVTKDGRLVKLQQGVMTVEVTSLE